MFRKKWLLLALVSAFILFGGFLIGNQVQADASGTPESSWFYGMRRWMGFNNNEYGCYNGGERYPMMGGYYDQTQESDETYYMIFPSVEATDFFSGETFYVTILDSEDEIVFEGEQIANPMGGIGVWLENDFEGTITVTYESLSGTDSLTQDSDTSWCISKQIIIELE
ncbi:MAG: hypothetical protein KKE16_05275 [Firmicutes bacterium]|nr:hypothetical protein [Bacillota bacterium]